MKSMSPEHQEISRRIHAVAQHIFFYRNGHLPDLAEARDVEDLHRIHEWIESYCPLPGETPIDVRTRKLMMQGIANLRHPDQRRRSNHDM